VNCVVAVVSVHVVDFAVEDEPALRNPLRDAPRYRPEVEVIVLAEQMQKMTWNGYETEEIMHQADVIFYQLKACLAT
jgi:hypothetical protein